MPYCPDPRDPLPQILVLFGILVLIAALLYPVSRVVAP